MNKVTIPIHMNTVNEETLPVYLSQLKQCEAQRVFLCPKGCIYDFENEWSVNAPKIEKAIRFFQENGFEVGVWVSAFGHGGVLSHESAGRMKKRSYTDILGINGERSDHAYCPLDENFARDYRNAIVGIANMHPDIIFLDDDFRLNGRRQYYLGCFCPLHIKEYYKRIGEKVPKEKLESLLFAGEKNKYRSAYMKLYADTLLDFAKMLRAAVDEVDETIRLGACTSFEHWDFCGTDTIAIAKAFAGRTVPLTRTVAAPYYNIHIDDVIEDTRMQAAWCLGTGVEAMAEEDPYPRPRYNMQNIGTAAKYTELFDLAVLVDGNIGGRMKYIVDYVQKPEYETGYIEAHCRNAKFREQIREIFSGKTSVGVRVFSEIHKIESADMPAICEEKVAKRLIERSYRSTGRNLLSKNGICTAYQEIKEPVLVCGEHAKYIGEEELKYGAILDAPAAQILMKRGIDTGLLSQENSDFAGEYFIDDQDEISGLKGVSLRKIICNPHAKILSYFTPNKSPAAYRYENEQGMRFLVLAYDEYHSDLNYNYFNNYYRQAQLIDGIEWVGRKNLPAVSTKNPFLYMMASSDDEAMSVALFNLFLDDIAQPMIRLDKEYKEIRFVNCSGELQGDKVYLTEIPAYSFAAFEVR